MTLNAPGSPRDVAWFTIRNRRGELNAEREGGAFCARRIEALPLQFE